MAGGSGSGRPRWPGAELPSGPRAGVSWSASHSRGIGVAGGRFPFDPKVDGNWGGKILAVKDRRGGEGDPLCPPGDRLLDVPRNPPPSRTPGAVTGVQLYRSRASWRLHFPASAAARRRLVSKFLGVSGSDVRDLPRGIWKCPGAFRLSRCLGMGGAADIY